MSIHRSLHIRAFGKKKRSVLKRAEKIKKLEAEGKWKEGDSVYHLPKVKVVRIKIPKKEAKPKTELVLTPEWQPTKHKKKSKDIGKIK